MTDLDRVRLMRARRVAAALYRKDGFNDFAARVERGEADDCQGMLAAMSALLQRAHAGKADGEAATGTRPMPLQAIIHH